MNANKLFPGKYLKSDDFDEDTVLTISRLAEEEVGQDRELKGILYFEETDKGLVLNKTNVGTIIDVLKSSESDDWIGQRITLYPIEVPFGPKMVMSIRVRLSKPKAAKAPSSAAKAAAALVSGTVESVSDKDIPF